jgi:hypothetical protein
MVFKEIVDYQTNGSEVKANDAYIVTLTRTSCKQETTIGWEILIE